MNLVFMGAVVLTALALIQQEKCISQYPDIDFLQHYFFVLLLIMSKYNRNIFRTR